MVAGRYVFTALACLGNMMTLLGRDSLRIAVLAMPDISPEQRSHVLGGYSYGMVVTMVAGGPLADTLGGKWLLAAVVLLSAACTAMVPLLADTTAAGLVACQAECRPKVVLLSCVVLKLRQVGRQTRAERLRGQKLVHHPANSIIH